MCDEADGQCQVWDGRWVRARNQHECMACDEAIATGATYHRVDSLYDGAWSHWVHCARCWRIWEAIESRAREDGDFVAIDPRLDCGEVWDGPPEDVAALAFALPGESGEAESYAAEKMVTAP